MTENIKKAVETFDNKNGNKDYSNKDLLKYIVHRLDSLPCIEQGNIIRELQTTISNLKWFAGLLIGINFSFVGGILFLLIQK